MARLRAATEDGVTLPEWARLMAGYWTYPSARTQAEVSMFELEIERTITRNTPGDGELCNAIRWLAGPENRQEKCPTLRELIRAIFILRKKQREADAPPPEMDGDGVCASCYSTGLVQYWPSLHHNTATLDDYENERYISVACRCAKGQKVAQYTWTPTQTQWERLTGQAQARMRLIMAKWGGCTMQDVIKMLGGMAKETTQKEELCPF